MRPFSGLVVCREVHITLKMSSVGTKDRVSSDHSYTKAHAW